MTDKNLVSALRKVEFLEDFEDDFVEMIASVTDLLQFEEGEVIFREGDAADYIYLVASGSVSLEICAPALGCRRILTIEAGNLLGWSPVLGQSRITSTARTLAPTQAYRIQADQLLSLCEQNTRFGYVFMRRVALGLAKRLSAARLQLLDVFGTEASAHEQPDSELA